MGSSRFCSRAVLGLAVLFSALHAQDASARSKFSKRGVNPECKITEVSRSGSGEEVTARVKVVFSEPVRNFRMRDLMVRGAEVNEFASEKGERLPSSTFWVRIDPHFPRGESIGISTITVRSRVATGQRSKSSNESCGPVSFRFNKRPTRRDPEPTDTATPTPTLSPIATESPTPLPTATATTEPTIPDPRTVPDAPEYTATSSPTPSPLRTPGNTSTPTRTPAVTATATRTPVTGTPTSTPTATPQGSAPSGDSCSATVTAPASQLPIFPDAEGFGTKTVAGSGRHSLQPCTKIFRVTNLKDSGAGSLRDCVEAAGPRTCIFEVAGMIWATKELRVRNPFLTIAGQTAPAPGIAIRGSGLSVEANDVLIQHLRMRTGDDPRAACCKLGTCGSLEAQLCTQDPGSRDGIKAWAYAGAINNIVFDHVSISWALDEGFSLVPDKGDVSNLTFSNSIIGAGLDMSIHPEASLVSDPGHSKGVLVSGAQAVKNFSFHKNLLAHNADRNIRISTPVTMEYINNVVYGWGRGRAAGRTIELANKGAVHMIDLVGNMYVPSLDTFCPTTEYLPERCFESGADGIDTPAERLNMHYIIRVGAGLAHGLTRSSRYFIRDNFGPTRQSAADDEWLAADRTFYTSSTSGTLIYPENRAAAPVAGSDTVTAMQAADAYNFVLARAGARPLNRDSVDLNLVADVTNRTGRIINCVADDGSARCAKNAGGWPYYEPVTRALTPPAEPNGDSDSDGYTNLEEWLFSYSQELE